MSVARNHQRPCDDDRQRVVIRVLMNQIVPRFQRFESPADREALPVLGIQFSKQPECWQLVFGPSSVRFVGHAH